MSCAEVFFPHVPLSPTPSLEQECPVSARKWFMATPIPTHISTTAYCFKMGKWPCKLKQASIRHRICNHFTSKHNWVAINSGRFGCSVKELLFTLWWCSHSNVLLFLMHKLLNTARDNCTGLSETLHSKLVMTRDLFLPTFKEGISTVYYHSATLVKWWLLIAALFRLKMSLEPCVVLCVYRHHLLQKKNCRLFVYLTCHLHVTYMFVVQNLIV
jgi:hypothetical protein